jgi:hypothetical protein
MKQNISGRVQELRNYSNTTEKKTKNEQQVQNISFCLHHPILEAGTA